MYDALTCEMTAKSVCPPLGGTYNADFCKAGGPGCDHALVVPGIDGRECVLYIGTPSETLAKVCCSAYENYAKAACTGIDSAKLEEAVTITVPSRA